jgi:succinate-semialdehyde dehydrogenase/glutarate-semialdehyde dehydrogenase
MAPGVDLGPLATREGAESLARQIDQSVKAGAKLVVGGHRIDGPGNYFAPAVLSEVPRAAPAYSEELFGPVAVLFEAQNLDHALELANDTPFGLSSSVWTNVPSEQERCARELESGQTFVNAMTASDPRLPFGGIKRSGYGRELGALGPREFTNIKTVVTALAENSRQA